MEKFFRLKNITFPNIKTIVNHDLCTGCGICQGACPSNAITIIPQNGLFRPVVDESKCNNSKGCHRCYDACPGIGVNLSAISSDIFKDENVQYDKMVGRYLKCYTGFSNDYDIRFHSASGGMVTQFLIWLLEHKKIDGAVVTKFDNSNPLMVSTYIATTKDEIIAGRSSKYAPVSLNNIAQQIRINLGTKFVVVGLPCHIHGIRKLMAMDKKLREKIIGLFGIFCSSGRSFNLTEYVMKERGIDRNKLQYFQYRDEGCLGSLKAIVSDNHKKIKPFNSYSKCKINGNLQEYQEEYQSYYNLRSFFVPRRCLFCIDHYAELADISFGDIHIKPYSDDKVGVNSIIARNDMWLSLLLDCKRDGTISLDEIPFKIISDSQIMSFKKKGRNGAFIGICKTLGMQIPSYDVDYLRKPTIRDWVDYIQNRVQQFIGRHKKLWCLIPFLKPKVKVD